MIIPVPVYGQGTAHALDGDHLLHGVRVSEVKYITVEALKLGKAEISLKGKIRTILLPNKLCRKLLKYAKKQRTASGEVFLTRNGTGLSRKQIWAEMKSVCEKARVAASKVFPHNLRHLFARTFYKVCRDVARLADVLGHSSIETTRIYLISTGVEHARTLELSEPGDPPPYGCGRDLPQRRCLHKTGYHLSHGMCGRLVCLQSVSQ